MENNDGKIQNVNLRGLEVNGEKGFLALLLVEITIYWLRRKKMVTKLKSEEYGGRTIIFVKGRGGMIFAQSPAITSQYIGVGRTKELAFEDAKNNYR